MNKYLRHLQRLGLDTQEARLYVALLKQSPATISQLSQASGLYRPAVYKLLPSLVDKDLVSKTVIGKRMFYSAEPPSALQAYAQETKNHIDEVLIEFETLFAHSRHRPVIRFFEGKSGVAHIYKDLMATCKKGDTIYRYESPKDYHRIKAYYPKEYIERATGPGHDLDKFVITNEKTHMQRRPRLDRYSKAIPASHDPFDYDITQIIYGNKVAFIDYETEIASLIESPSFARFQRQLFKLLFNKL